MFTKKIYKCKCRICGKEHDYESEFLSCLTITTEDGRSFADIPCPTHTWLEVRTSWLKLNGYSDKEIMEKLRRDAPDRIARLEAKAYFVERLSEKESKELDELIKLVGGLSLKRLRLRQSG